MWLANVVDFRWMKNRSYFIRWFRTAAANAKAGRERERMGNKKRRLWLLLYLSWFEISTCQWSLVAFLRSVVVTVAVDDVEPLAYVDDDNDHTKRYGSTFCLSRDGFKLSPMEPYTTDARISENYRSSRALNAARRRASENERCKETKRQKNKMRCV